MTKVQAKEAIEVLKAYCEGKELEVADKNIGNWGDVLAIEPCFNFDSFDYRIKPTEEYRPYKDCDEMIADYKARFNTNCSSYAMPLIWVKHKKSNCRYLIHTYAENEVYINNDRYTLEELFEYFEYLNGSKIGVRV